MDSLQSLLEDELKDLYSAENQLVKALPKMAKKASNAKLKQAFTSHLAETEGHVKRLERIAKMIDAKLTGKKCHAMEGLIDEGKESVPTPYRDIKESEGKPENFKLQEKE